MVDQGGVRLLGGVGVAPDEAHRRVTARRASWPRAARGTTRRARGAPHRRAVGDVEQPLRLAQRVHRPQDQQAGADGDDAPPPLSPRPTSAGSPRPAAESAGLGLARVLRGQGGGLAEARARRHMAEAGPLRRGVELAHDARVAAPADVRRHSPHQRLQATA